MIEDALGYKNLAVDSRKYISITFDWISKNTLSGRLPKECKKIILGMQIFYLLHCSQVSPDKTSIFVPYILVDSR